MQLSVLDISLVVAYLLFVAGLGLWVSRGVRSSKDLFLGGRSLPWWAVGMSLVVSDIGAKDMVGLADDGYRYGLVMANFDLIGCVFPVLIAAFVFMPYLWIAGVYTVPEYLGRRYNSTVRYCFAVVWAGFMIATLGTIFVSAGTMFENLLGWNFLWAVVLTAIVVGLYTAIGGLKAVVYTDMVSCIVLIIGAAAICIIGLHEVGGWQALQEKVNTMPDTQHHFSLLRPAEADEYSWPSVLLGLGFVLGPAYWIGNQAIVQRSFGTRSASEARASYLLCAGIKMVFPFLLVVPGLIALGLFSEKLGAPGADRVSGSVLPLLVQLLPTGMLGIVLGAFFAGIMSNLDSYVNSAATLCVTDLYKPLIHRSATDAQCLRTGRLLVVVFLVGGVISAPIIRAEFSSVFDAFQSFLSLFQGALLALLLLGMLTRHATQWGGVAGFLTGVCSAAIMQYILDWHFLWVAWWSFVAALAATISVSDFTKPYNEERLRGLVYWLPAEQETKP